MRRWYCTFLMAWFLVANLGCGSSAPTEGIPPLPPGGALGQVDSGKGSQKFVQGKKAFPKVP